MNIIVTGASRGIGYETCRLFCRDDGNRVIAISRSQDRLEELHGSCVKDFRGSTLHNLPFDLEDLQGIEKLLAQKIGKLFDSVDILVNNAGLLVNTPVLEMDPKDAERMMRVNFLAPMILVRSLLPLLEKGSEPHVLNIGSMAGIQGGKKFVGLSAYSASKAAVHTLTECLAVEFRESGIHFNALALGAVRTEMLAEAFPGLEPPLNALQMAEYIRDFAMKGQRYYNGKVLPVAISTP
jgi:NAD(P)-dependent dehydrogenase (short-subunit alcohol dehydrogenase family)